MNEKKKKAERNFTQKTVINRIAILVIILMAAYALLSFNPLLSTGGDSATYILLADSFSEGRPMQYSLDGSSLNPTYPPVYPFLLFLVSLVSGARNIIAFKALSFAAFIFQICIFYLLTGYFTKNNLKRLLGLILFASLSVQIQLSSEILSESVFMAFLLASFYFYVKRLNDNRKKSLYLSLLFGLLASYTREVGVILFPIYFINEIIEKNKRNLVVVAMAFILSRVWSVVLLMNGVESIYYKQIIYANWYNQTAEKMTFIGLAMRLIKTIYTNFMLASNQLIHSFKWFVNLSVMIFVIAKLVFDFIKGKLKNTILGLIYISISILGISFIPYPDVRFSIQILFILTLMLISDSKVEISSVNEMRKSVSGYIYI